jgi:D-alanyl-D-alanine carboxypeptidase
MSLRLLDPSLNPPASRPGPDFCHCSSTSYTLARMIVEWVTHDAYADQLLKPIITPLRLHSLGYAPYTCPQPQPPGCPPDTPLSLLRRSPCRSTHRCRASRFPSLALTRTQDAAGIVSSLQDMTTWHRARPRPGAAPRQRRQLESLAGPPERYVRLDGRPHAGVVAGWNSRE